MHTKKRKLCLQSKYLIYFAIKRVSIYKCFFIISQFSEFSFKIAIHIFINRVDSLTYTFISHKLQTSILK